jgi:serine/threonine protein kinase
MSSIIGQSIGRYHVLDQLGEGGMATVYKAYDTRLERDVAIKIIRRGAFPPEQLEHMLKRFEREAKSLAKLSHPNIVKVLDFGEYQDAPYLVMEYLPGGTLKQRTGKPVPWQEAVRLLVPIAQALEYAHEHNLIHRDIKPANILLTEKGQPMLTDFGIAKILEANEAFTLTGTGVGVGTPEYMAPEQWTGETTTQSDIYSLGVVFYEMVTGRKPYTADTPAAALLKQATDPLPRPTQFAPDLPDAVEKVLLKALAKRLEDRYQTATELSNALEHLIGQTGEFAQQNQTITIDTGAPQPEQSVGWEKTNEDLGTLEVVEPTPVPTPFPAPIPIPVSARVPAPAPDPVPAPVPVSEPPRKSRGWMWAVGALLLVLCLCVPLGFGAYNLVTSGVIVLPDSISIATRAPASTSPTLASLPTQSPLPTYTPYPAKTAAPTMVILPTVAPITLPQQWDGFYNQTGYGKVRISLIIDELDGNAFKGRMLWLPTQAYGLKYNLTINRMNGEYVQNFGNASEQTRWSNHPDYSKNQSGTWLKWTEIEMISGNSPFTMNGWYYAHIRTDGTLFGIYYFNATETTPAKDSYELELAN